jgi:hypothetical protein
MSCLQVTLIDAFMATCTAGRTGELLTLKIPDAFQRGCIPVDALGEAQHC